MDSQPKLLAHAVLTKANEVPDSPWLLYSKSSKWQKENGYDRITWKQFACAISKAAFWLDENIPRKTAGRQTFAYQGPNDARYYILIVAAAISKRTVSFRFSFLSLIRQFPDKIIFADIHTRWKNYPGRLERDLDGN